MNKFFKQQEEDRLRNERQREDKHLLPQTENFIDPLTKQKGKIKDDYKLPYQAIDIIFNHKNVWANMQNPNPQVIWYHIHDNTKWLPLISDPL